MLHLPADRLAELVDVAPTRQEWAHLEICAECARERHAYAALRNLARAERHAVIEPLTSWADLRRGLEDEGVLASPVLSDSVRLVHSGKRRFSRSRIALAAAASFALVTTGMAIGRFVPLNSAAVQTGSSAVSPRSGTVGSDVISASSSFQSRDQAVQELLRAQQDYQRAAAFLLASDTTIAPTAPNLYRERLAALDEVMGVTRDALVRAPHDPVMNSYYLATLGAREATLQQLQLALPAGTRIDSF
jgi:hypothetical protein